MTQEYEYAKTSDIPKVLEIPRNITFKVPAIEINNNLQLLSQLTKEELEVYKIGTLNIEQYNIIDLSEYIIEICYYELYANGANYPIVRIPILPNENSTYINVVPAYRWQGAVTYGIDIYGNIYGCRHSKNIEEVIASLNHIYFKIYKPNYIKLKEIQI